jgi:hypothetical protein
VPQDIHRRSEEEVFKTPVAVGAHHEEIEILGGGDKRLDMSNTQMSLYPNWEPPAMSVAQLPGSM